MAPRQPSLAIPLLHHIYTFLFAGELAERGERGGLAVWAAGRAAGRLGGDGRFVFVHFAGRNAAHSHASEKCRSDAILARSVGPWRCSMRASGALNRALHGGMRHVCVGVRLFTTSGPPNIS